MSHFFSWLLIAFCFFSTNKIIAQGENPKPSARAAGLGDAAVTIADEWALFNNISGIAQINNPTAGFSYQNKWGISGFNSVALGLLYPTKVGVPGFSLYRFGDQHYNEQFAGLGYGHKINNVSLGIKANYLQIVMEDISTKRNLIIEFGGMVEVAKKLVFGAHIYNLNQAKIKGSTENKIIPVTMKAGLSYRPIKELMFNVETEKNVNYKASFKSGLEYAIIDKIKLRTGISTFPYVNYFGIGINHKNFQIDYAINTHNSLGISQNISLSYKIKKKVSK